MKLQVKLDKRSLNKILRASDKVVVVAKTQKEEFPRYAAETYTNRVLKAINSVRWKYRYNQRYMDWKIKNYGVHVPWKLEGDLVKALKSYKLTTVGGKVKYLGGVKAGITDSGGKSWFGKRGANTGKVKEIAMYGRAVEKTKPMFVPVFNEFKPMLRNKFKTVVTKFRRTWR